MAMNILFICNEYPPYPHGGGIGTVTRIIAEGMRTRGHTVVVAGFYDSIETYSSRDERGVLVYRLPQSKLFNHDFYSRIILFRLVRKIIKNHSINILEAPDYLGLLALWPRFSIPSVVRLHGSVTYLSSESSKKISKKYFFYESQTLKNCSALIAVSKSIAVKTNALFKMKAPIEIIYNSIGIDNPIGQKINKRELNKVIFTGTLMKIKGVFPLFEAWPEVVSKIPQATLHLFGKDSFNESGISVKALLLQNLMPQLLETVTFYGHVSRQQVFKELNTASVAVFPSITETFGLGPAEAMAQGCPTIFTKLASGPEIINNGVNGILVDPFNPKEIAEAIIRILADKNLAQKIGFEGRKSVENRFSNDVILQQNEKMYQKVIAEFNSTRWKKPLIQKGLYKIDLPHD